MLTASGSSPDIGRRIDSTYKDLSRQEQRVADFILDHLDELAVYSATELARHSEVSKATVSRLFRRLGYASFQEVHEHARTLRTHGVPPDPARTTSAVAPPWADQLRQEQLNTTKMVAALSDGRLEQVTLLLARAREVLVVGQRNSYPLALHLRQQLIQSRERVRLAPQPGQSLGEDLAGLAPRDAVVLIGFRRRPASFERQLAAVTAMHVPCILIADGSARRYADRVTHWLECPVDSASALDSYAAAMSLLHLLATGVLGRHLRSGRSRIPSLNPIYAELDELEPTP
jgi:DNA-binding MurR/RpiR family transcriptional regulator